MEVLGGLAWVAVVLGPWILAGLALARANRACEEAGRARAAAEAARRAWERTTTKQPKPN